MILSAEQQCRVAAVYESAVEDASVPPPVRAAFARKARRFRTLARVAAEIEATTVVKQAPILKPDEEPVPEDSRSEPVWKPQAEYQSLAERLEMARAASEEAKALQARQRYLGALAVQKVCGGRQALPMRLVALVAIVALTAVLLGCTATQRTVAGATLGGAAGAAGGVFVAGPIGAVAGAAGGAAIGAYAAGPTEQQLRSY